MLYPHEREERKQLLNGFIDSIHSSRKPLGIVALVLGVALTGAAVLNSLFLVTLDNAAALWFAYWSALTLLFGLSLFFTFPLLQRPKKSIFNPAQQFIALQLLPYYLTGGVVVVLLTHDASNQLVTTALAWCITHAMALLSLRAYADGSLKNLATAAIIIPVSLTVVLQRHSELTINPYHLANIILILGIGIPHTIYGMWMVLIKNR